MNGSGVCQNCSSHSDSVAGSTSAAGCLCNAGFSKVDGGACTVIGSGTNSCGDKLVQSELGETCDDGNASGGDGCSAECTLETGYMCYNAVRSGNRETAGSMVQWITNTSSDTAQLLVLAGGEACTREHICVQSTQRWDAGSWSELYKEYPPGAGVFALEQLPPSGFYCEQFCVQTFTPPEYHELNETCMPHPINECRRGTTTCDVNALCTEPAHGVGYSCQCDPKYFVDTAGGGSCATSGLEIQFTLGGMQVSQVPFAASEDRSNILQARLMFIDKLVSSGYVNARSSPELLLEGVDTYPIDRISENVQDPDSSVFGRSLWRIILRAPASHFDLAKMQQGLIFGDIAVWHGIFHNSSKYLVNSIGKCVNDQARTCSPAAVSSSSCLGGAQCRLVPDFSYEILSSGGASAPLQIGSSGLQVKSIDYDVVERAFRIRMRFDNVLPGVINTVFLSHMGTNAVLQSTFRSDEFPCLPLGTGVHQNQREDSVCCLDRFYDRYTTLSSFKDYIADTGLPLRQEIDGQGSCTALDSAPVNATADLLDSSLDFVNGTFARMPRSHAKLDPAPTRGYQDVMLLLALEDVQGVAALTTPLLTSSGDAAGDRLRFFVGMAHIKPVESSNRLVVSSSQVEINADITNTYQYTTQTSTDFTFVRDVSVQLSQVKLPGVGASSMKFATISLVVPASLTQADADNIIPHLSLKVGVGFTPNSISSTAYPCVETYSGANKDAIDAALQAQQSCALQNPMCRAQGPVAVGPGGSIQFTFPLDNNVWDDALLDDDTQQLRSSIFIDFMVAAVDANGNQLITNLKTRTVLKRTSVLSRYYPAGSDPRAQ